MTRPIALTVNGQPRTIDIDPRTPLLYALRNDLELNGPKYGCGEEQCGACMVLIDGEPLPSCKRPIGEVEGRDIRTLEWIGTLESLHPVQQAFVDEQAAQCGFCTNGMIVCAYALLRDQPAPDEQTIRESLRRVLCRCGSQSRVVRAIERLTEQTK